MKALTEKRQKANLFDFAYHVLIGDNPSFTVNSYQTWRVVNFELKEFVQEWGGSWVFNEDSLTGTLLTKDEKEYVLQFSREDNGTLETIKKDGIILWDVDRERLIGEAGFQLPNATQPLID